MPMSKYLLLFIVSIGLTATSRYFYVEQYRREAHADSITQGLELIQRRSGAYFDQENEVLVPALASPPWHHEHEHRHITGIILADAEDVVEKPASATHGGENEHLGHHEHHEHHGHEDQAPDPAVSPGFVLLLRQLGFAELAANLLWIQMDADSHRELWYRVEFALELIPALDPTFVDAYLLRSFLLDEYQGRHDEALQILENAVQQVPGRIELWQQIGLFCLNHTGRHGPKRHPERALGAFLKACDFSDAPPYLVRMAAVSLAVMEHRDEAVRLLEQIASDSKRPPDQQQLDRAMAKRIRQGEKF